MYRDQTGFGWKKLERYFVVVAAASVPFRRLHFHCRSCCGSLEYYDKTYDRVNVKNEKPLQRIDRIFHTVTTTDDPVIRKLSKTEGNVYATDAILATLMCCTRSNYSWDIVIEKIGEKLFFDKRDNTEFGNLLTV
jgi:translation initiation factor 3 subunit D